MVVIPDFWSSMLVSVGSLGNPTYVLGAENLVNQSFSHPNGQPGLDGFYPSGHPIDANNGQLGIGYPLECQQPSPFCFVYPFRSLSIPRGFPLLAITPPWVSHWDIGSEMVGASIGPHHLFITFLLVVLAVQQFIRMMLLGPTHYCWPCFVSVT